MPTPNIYSEQWLHGRRMVFRDTGGSGPTVLLVHGITNSSRSWEPVTGRLAGSHRVLAPDLPGHGDSDRHQGDHSLGAHASALRDLLLATDAGRATLVGHSFGGGIVLQMAYQFPELVERIVLVSSGGLGRDVGLALRAATLPGAEQVIGLGASAPVARAGAFAGSLLSRFGVHPGPDISEVLSGVASLGDRQRRESFVRTIRTVVSPRGQRVTAIDRLYLAEGIPSLIVWGDRDPIIPADHGRAAAAAMPDSRFELFEGAGHFPQLNDPERFSAMLAEFIATTEPATLDLDALRGRILARGPKRS